MNSVTCSVVQCDKPIKRAGFCYGHYMKNWRYGTPTPDFSPTYVDITGERYGLLTVVERRGSKWLCVCDCGSTRTVNAGELNRTGDRNSCGNRDHRWTSDAGYGAAHRRVMTKRGKASAHRCIDCGGRAYHWSYNHRDPNELHDETMSDRAVAYSLDWSYYEPRCVPCHKAFDLGRLDAA